LFLFFIIFLRDKCHGVLGFTMLHFFLVKLDSALKKISCALSINSKWFIDTSRKFYFTSSIIKNGNSI